MRRALHLLLVPSVVRERFLDRRWETENIKFSFATNYLAILGIYYQNNPFFGMFQLKFCLTLKKIFAQIRALVFEKNAKTA